MSKQPRTDYFKVVATESTDSADLYIYGYIGQDYWWDDDLNEESLTDLAVVRKIKELEAKYSRINIRINSPGGSVFHGDPIISAMRNSPAEIHTYIDGMAASMAADIWAVGKVRHMNMNSKLMIHATSTIAFGTALEMMEAAEMLEKFDQVAIATFASVTSMTEEDIRTKFYDYRDHWVTAPEAVEMGLIEKVEDYSAEEITQDVERMSYSQLIRQFSQQKEEQHKSLFEQLREKIFNRAQRQAPAPEIINNQTEEQMKIEDFQKSLGEELAVDAVITELQSRGYTVEKAATPEPATVAPAQDITKAVADAVAPLFAKIESLEGQVKTLGDQPGAGRTDTPAGADTPDGVDTTSGYDALKALAASANNRERVDTLG
jgi:ATP-dependent Clp protease, protease subunit